jgi:NitT/TauT family transport system substrate-binding protein
VTHAPALVGLHDGIFARELAAMWLDAKANAGPAVIEALFAGEIDISYIGPNPSINCFVQSNGEALRVISGAASGGASRVVRADRGIERPADLAGKTIATPQLGNTQDVALRAWLLANGLKAKEQGGSVTVLPTENATTLTLFQKGDIDGVPEPWATRLIQQAAGGSSSMSSLWGGRFVTTK